MKKISSFLSIYKQEILSLYIIYRITRHLYISLDPEEKIILFENIKKVVLKKKKNKNDVI